MEEIRVITNGDELRALGAKAFMEYINPFIEEKALLLLEKEITLHEEEKWLDRMAKEIEEGNNLVVILVSDGKLAGLCEARRQELKGKNNILFGISVSIELRGKGYGEAMLKKAIELAKKRMNPHRMWIDLISGNEPARKLYEKLGFVEVARLKEYIDHYGEWKDKVIMEYRGK